MSPTAYKEQLDQLSQVLAKLHRALNEEERDALGLELLDVTRAEADDDAYERALTPWVLTIIARQHPDFDVQVKEYNNLLSSGEIFGGVNLGGLPQLT